MAGQPSGYDPERFANLVGEGTRQAFSDRLGGDSELTDVGMFEFAKIFVPPDEVEELRQLQQENPLDFQRAVGQMAISAPDFLGKFLQGLEETYNTLRTS